MTNWISVKDCYPSNLNSVLVYTIPCEGRKREFTPQIFIATYCYCKGWTELVSNHELKRYYREGREATYYDLLHMREIMYWMPLPDAPTEK